MNTDPTGNTLPPLYGDRVRWALAQADSLTLLEQLPEACVDAVVTDPPYGLAFGDAGWDGGRGNRALSSGDGFERFSRAWGEACLRALKPGGYLVSFGAPRTVHRLVTGLEDAGLEIRDQLMWLYSSGMPKSRRIEGGLGTALKPAYEPIVLARRPLDRRAGRTVSVTANLLLHGTGAMNIAATRLLREAEEAESVGYWPANITAMHDDVCTSTCSVDCAVRFVDGLGVGTSPLSRIFYSSKASRREREIGLDGLPEFRRPVFSDRGGSRDRRNVHPTVKPLGLMRWLVRLVALPGAVVLDPFAGSGSTGCAVLQEGGQRQFVGIERETQFAEIACARLRHWASESASSQARKASK